MRLASVLLSCMLCSVAFAQVDVRSATYYRLDGLGEIINVGDLTLVESAPSLVVTPVGVVRVDTEAANVEVSVSDLQRVPYEPTKVSNGVWVIEKPGQWWVDVTAIDFKKNIYGRKQAVVVVGGNGPGPKPPGPGPNPPPSPIPNEYGVGKVAYDSAPRDAATAAKHANIYRQAADFLFGIPSLKFIVSSNQAQANDPNRSVMAWINQQYGLIQCTDIETCKQWTEWRKQVSLAIVESQKRRQFTRDDWYSAFNEIARALQEVR